MRFKSKTKFFIYFLFAFFGQCLCVDFDQKYFGVVFSPWAKDFSEGVPMKSTYTYDNVNTMLSLVSGKFSKLLVEGNFDYLGFYLPNFTYHRGSYVNLYAGEMAATLNKKNGNKTVSIIYKLIEFDSSSVEDARIDISLVFEAAEKANQIFPGTVEGVSLDIMEDLERTLGHLKTYREKANALGIKLGAYQDCRGYFNPKDDVLKNQIVNSADFIVCSLMASNPSLGPVKKWPSIDTDFMAFRHAIGRINSSVEVIGRTMWSSSGLKEWESVENLREYWELANGWATQNQYRLYMLEAIDNPYRQHPPGHAHWGWWKLRKNSEIDSLDGYVEKASEPSPTTTTVIVKEEITISTESSLEVKDTSTTFNSSGYAANDDDVPNQEEKQDKAGRDELSKSWADANYILLVTVGVIGGILVCNAVVILLFFRRTKNRPVVEVMTAQDIRDFILGTINESNSKLKRSETAVENALNVPYDNSLEIPKENLKIDHKQELGSGQFGYVFKAIIEMDGKEAVEVAVKVAKENCQLPALKGLLSEIKIMTYLGEHSNVVVLKGAYTAELSKGRVYVATELCSLGSLEGYLRKYGSIGNENVDASQFEKSEQLKLKELGKNENADISFQEMVRWSREIACGMEYLEKKQVVHADLATRNVLLSADKTAKITDFGLSRRMYNYMNYVKQNQEPLPWRWMAIESLKRLEFSSKSDVWGYGVTLWEIFSKGDTPYPGLTWTQGFVNRLESGLRPNCPKFASPEISNIMRDCWTFDSSERPSFSELVDSMTNLLPKSQAITEPASGMNVYSNFV